MRWLLALAIPLAACATNARGDHFEDAIEAAEKARGNDVEVRCPDRIPLGRVDDNRFECEIDSGAASIVVTVKIDDKGNLAWAQDGAIRFRFEPDAIEAEIRDGIKKQAKVDLDVDCGVARAADADGTWTCTATSPDDGSSGTIRVSGDGSWRVIED